MQKPLQRTYIIIFMVSIICIVAISTAIILWPGTTLAPARQAKGMTPTQGVAVAPTATATPHVPQLLRPTFERGMVFPRWRNDGFTASDTTWHTQLPVIAQQTGTQWLQLVIPLEQANGQSTTVDAASAPDPQAFEQPIQDAHSMGYKVFMAPNHLVHIASGWSADIQFATQDQEKAWFDALFAAYKPYLEVAQRENVEQVSIGTELVWMQNNAPSALWDQYINETHALYHGSLTYDTNWSDISLAIPNWMHSSLLSYIGVSEYIPLTDTQTRISESQMAQIWKQKVQMPLDTFSEKIGKPLILSEIGYRNSFDAGWNPWDATAHAPEDPLEQAAAIDAALSNSFQDVHILGTFWWGWTDVGALNLAGSSAIPTIKAWYTKKV